MHGNIYTIALILAPIKGYGEHTRRLSLRKMFNVTFLARNAPPCGWGRSSVTFLPCNASFSLREGATVMFLTGNTERLRILSNSGSSGSGRL